MQPLLSTMPRTVVIKWFVKLLSFTLLLYHGALFQSLQQLCSTAVPSHCSLWYTSTSSFSDDIERSSRSFVSCTIPCMLFNFTHPYAHSSTKDTNCQYLAPIPLLCTPSNAQLTKLFKTRKPFCFSEIITIHQIQVYKHIGNVTTSTKSLQELKWRCWMLGYTLSVNDTFELD